MSKLDFNWRIGGRAGEGIMVSGRLMSKAFTRGGLHIFTNTEHPSLIRGGHNTIRIRVSDQPVHAQVDEVHLLVALNQETIDRHAHELPREGGVIFDPDVVKNVGKVRGQHYPIPLKQIVEEVSGSPVMINMVALGASFSLLQYPLSYLEQLLKEQYLKKKGAEVVKRNVAAARKGYRYVEKHFPDDFSWEIQPDTKAPKRMFISGNQASALGAIQAGCKWMSAYPMTPATSIMQTLAVHERTSGIIVKQTEDEIAAMAMAVGAAHVGARAMTATSGGGFALMSEVLSLAGTTETPIVAVNVTRSGSSTGLPTRTEQGDLRFVLHTGHGEFPRVVVSPGSVTESFHLTAEAFNIAEKYQLPVIVLTDKYLGESYTDHELFDLKRVKIQRGKLLTEVQAKKLKNYKRYQLTADGVSPRTLPGYPNTIFRATGNEHDEHGHVTEEKDMRIAMVEKRMKKLETLAKELPQPELVGPAHATITLVGFGSTKGPILEAIEMLREKKVKVNYLQITYLHPFPSDTVKRILSSAKLPLVIENNHDAQLTGLIRERTGVTIPKTITKYDGRPFSAIEIVKSIVRLVH